MSAEMRTGHLETLSLSTQVVNTCKKRRRKKKEYQVNILNKTTSEYLANMSLPIIAGFERPLPADAQVLGLLIGQLREVSVKCGQVKTGHKLI